MSTNYTVVPIIGLPLKDYLAVSDGKRPVTKYNRDTGKPEVIEVYVTAYTFDGVEYIPNGELDGGYMGNLNEYPEDKPQSKLLEALEQAFPNLHVFIPPYYPQDGYIGIAVGQRVDQGQWDVFNFASREEIANAFDKVIEATGIYPSLNLMVYTS